jgi:hypothetical protein
MLCACVISKASMFAWTGNLSPLPLLVYHSGSGSLSVNVSMSDDAWSSTHIHVASGMGVETQEACSAEVSSHVIRCCRCHIAGSMDVCWLLLAFF